MGNKGEDSPFNIWPEPLELEEYEAAGDEENEEESDANGDVVDAATSVKEKAPEPDEFDKIAEELEALADGKETAPSNKVTKGLQRVIAKKDTQIQQLQREYKEALARQEAELAEQRELIRSINEAQNWQADTLLGNLEDDPRKDAELELHRRAAKFRDEQAARAQQRQQATAEPEPAAWEQELAQRIEAESRAFEDGLRELAVLVGVKPDNPTLDFGDATSETFNQRSAKFRASLKKAQDAELEADVKGVRGKPVNTRGANSGGDVPPRGDGLSPLERGSRARSSQMRKAFA